MCGGRSYEQPLFVYCAGVYIDDHGGVVEVTSTRLGGATEGVHPLAEEPTRTGAALATSLRVANDPAQTPEQFAGGSVPSYTKTGEPSTIHVVAQTAPTPVQPQTATPAATSLTTYNSKGQASVVASSGTGLSDGVYIAFNVTGVNGKQVPHEYVEVVIDGHKRMYEYGPGTTIIGGEGSPCIEMNGTYGDSDTNAGALFRVSAPKGESDAAFEQRTIALGTAMDNVLAEYHPYDVTAQAGINCYSCADAILLNDGVSFGTLDAVGLAAGKAADGAWLQAFQKAAPIAQNTPFAAEQTFSLAIEDAAQAGMGNLDWKGDASASQMQRNAQGAWQISNPIAASGSTQDGDMQVAFENGMQDDVADAAGVGGLIGTTLTQLLGLTGGQVDFSKASDASSASQLKITIEQIDQILGALENAIHGGNVTDDILQIAKALEARDPQGLVNVQSATQLYNDFQQIGKGPQQTIDGILAMGRDVLSWGQNPNNLTGSTGSLYNDLKRAQNDVDTGFAVIGDVSGVLHGNNPIASAAQLGNDLHLSGEVAKDYYDVLQGIGALTEIGKGGFMNITDGTVKVGEAVVSTNSAFGQWLHDHGQDIVGAAAAFEQILAGGGVLNEAQSALDLGQELVKLNVVSSNSALGSWLTQNGARFTGVIGGIESIIQGYEEGGIQGGVQAGIGADVLITSIGLSAGIATPVAIVVGILTIAFGGNHDNPATMPDKYDTQRYGQMVADMQGTMGANGQQFSEDGTLSKLFGGRTGIQAVEETLAYYGTKDNAPAWLKPLWDNLVAMFGESAQGSGHLSIGINGTGKDCNNQEVLGTSGLDGKVYQYTDLGSMLYAFAAALAAGTSGQGLAAPSGYTAAYPTIAGLDWHAVRTANGYGFYAEDQSNFGNFYSYDPANNNLYYGTNPDQIGGNWIGDVRTYDFANHSAITGAAPAAPSYGGIAWHGFSLQGGGVAYWGSVTTTTTTTIDPPDPPADPIKGISPKPILPRTITTHKTTYYFFGPDGVLYSGSGAGWLAKGSVVGNAATYDFTKGGVQTPAPTPPPAPAPVPPAPVQPAPLPVKPTPLPVKPPLPIKPIVTPRTMVARTMRVAL